MIFPAEWLYDSILDGNSNEEQGLKFIEEEDWEVQHKLQTKSFVFEYKDRFYIISIGRRGDDYKGWDREDEYGNELKDVKEFDCTEVYKVEFVHHVWRIVK